MKTSAFFKGLSSLILLNLLVKPVWMFFIDRQVQNTVGHEEYGRYFDVLNLSYVLFFLSDAGLGNMMNQRIANGQKLDIPQLLRIKLLMLALYISVCCLVGWLSQITQWTYLLYVLLIQVFTSLFILFRNMITGFQFFSTDAWLSIIDKSLMIILCGAILYTTYFVMIDLVGFLQVQAFCTAVAAIAAFWFLYRKNLLQPAENLQVKRIIHMILPFAIIILLMSVHYRLDGFLLERIHPQGALQAGIYASAYRLLDASNMVGYLSASFLVAFIARHQHDKDFLQDAVINTRHGLLFFVIGVVSFTAMYTPWIQQLLYHSNDHFHSEVIRYCIASLPGYFLVHIYGSVLTATGKFRTFITILTITVTINLLLNLFLIPVYGALGCCYAALASQYICGFACMLVTTRKFQIQLHYPSLLVYLGLAAMLTGFFYFAKSAGMNVWLSAGIAASATVLLLLTQIKKKYFVSLR